MATQADVATHLGISVQTVINLMHRGAIPPQPRSNWDIDQCRLSYIAHLRALAAGRSSDPQDLDLTEERTRLTKERADAAALKNKVMIGELLDAGEVKRAVSSTFVVVRDRLLRVPGRVSAAVKQARDPAEVRTLLSDAIADALSELAEGRTLDSIGGGDSDE